MLDLNDLRVFERVAALNSFSTAARKLALPRSTVSRNIRRLEAELGVKLLQRSTRAIALTAAGEALRERCLYILDRIDEASRYVGSLGASVGGTLRVSLEVGIDVKIFIDLLAAFLFRYPEVDLSLDMNSRTSDLIGERIDVALRLGPLPDSTFIATRIGSLDRLLCASPGYISMHGAPSRVEELAGHDLIEMTSPEGRPTTWLFRRNEEEKSIEAQARVYANEMTTVCELAVKGVGIAILCGHLCIPEIKAGHLVQLLPEWQLSPLDINLLFPSRRELSPAIRAFTDHMREFPRFDEL
jgi:DNA-binding transcriptional LysR family regulator